MKITFQGNELNLVGNQVVKGEKISDFVAYDNSLEPVTLRDTKGVRIFLTVPSIDTPVCDLEVATFNERVKEMPEVTCYTISMDLPFAQARWCAAKGVANVKTLSDYKNRKFGEVTGTYIKELGLLTRAAFVVDSNNEFIYIEYLDEITNQPSFEEILRAAKEAK